MSLRSSFPSMSNEGTPPPDEAPPGEETPEEHKARILDQPVWPSYQPEE